MTAVGAARTETFRSFRDLTFWSIFWGQASGNLFSEARHANQIRNSCFQKKFPPKSFFLLLKMDFKHDEDILGLNFFAQRSNLLRRATLLNFDKTW